MRDPGYCLGCHILRVISEALENPLPLESSLQGCRKIFAFILDHAVQPLGAANALGFSIFSGIRCTDAT